MTQPVEPPAALIAAIEANPDDRDARAVYADWLLEHGDPLGDIMALALKKDAATELSALTSAYVRTHFPAAAFSLAFDPSWKNGLVEKLYVVTHESVSLAKAINTTPATRFLREVAISFTRQHIAIEYGPAGEPSPGRAPEPADFPKDPIPTLAQYPFPRTLRKLYLWLDIEKLVGPETVKVPLDLNPLYPQLSKLEELHLSYPAGGLGQIDLPSLRSFTTSIFTKEAAGEVARANVPQLEHLRFESAYWALLENLDIPGTPKLEQLTLGSSEDHVREDGYAMMANAPLVKRVRTLEIRSQRDRDMPHLIRVAPRLLHLRELRLVDGFPKISDADRAALARILESRIAFVPP